LVAGVAPWAERSVYRLLDQQLGAGWSVEDAARPRTGLANHIIAVRAGAALYFAKFFTDPIASRRETTALRFLSKTPFPAPSIIASDFKFLLLQSVGTPLPAESRSAAELVQIGRALQRLHSLDTSELEPVHFRGSQADRLDRRFRACFTKTPVRRSLLHGDITWSNVVFNKTEHIVLIDFEEAALGDPLVDLSIAAVECCWNPRYSRRFETAVRHMVEGYNQPGMFSRLLAVPTEAKASACELAAEELLSWSRANEQHCLSQKYAAFIDFIRCRRSRRC
jgi:aminoglycoside phosphotransferase (APT) family kinase protein